jgi:hypothetical protein
VSGAAGIAMDLEGFAAVDAGSRNSRHLALVRITSTSPVTLIAYGAQPATDTWAVAYDVVDDDFFPAIAALTDGQLTVELSEVPVTTIGDARIDATIDADGRPQVFAVDPAFENGRFEIGGAEYEIISSYRGDGVASGPLPFGSFGSPRSGDVMIVFGEPGDRFTITPESFLPDPEPPPVPLPEPTPTPEQLPNTVTSVVGRFEDHVGEIGLEYSFESPGGYFDGCGPDNPEVTTTAFEALDGRFAVITPYRSSTDARAAFGDLLAIASPCEGFPDLVIDQVTPIGDDEVLITYDFGDDVLFFEQYLLRDDLILAGSADDPSTLEELMSHLRDF